MATKPNSTAGGKSGITSKSMLRLKLLEMMRDRSFAPLASQKAKKTETDKETIKNAK